MTAQGPEGEQQVPANVDEGSQDPQPKPVVDNPGGLPRQVRDIGITSWKDVDLGPNVIDWSAILAQPGTDEITILPAERTILDLAGKYKKNKIPYTTTGIVPSEKSKRDISDRLNLERLNEELLSKRVDPITTDSGVVHDFSEVTQFAREDPFRVHNHVQTPTELGADAADRYSRYVHDRLTEEILFQREPGHQSVTGTGSDAGTGTAPLTPEPVHPPTRPIGEGRFRIVHQPGGMPGSTDAGVAGQPGITPMQQVENFDALLRQYLGKLPREEKFNAVKSPTTPRSPRSPKSPR